MGIPLKVAKGLTKISQLSLQISKRPIIKCDCYLLTHIVAFKFLES